MDENEVKNIHTLCAYGQIFETVKIQQLVSKFLKSILRFGGGVGGVKLNYVCIVQIYKKHNNIN